MKFRESGMPLEQQWYTYFDPLHVLIQLGVDEHIKTLVDIGCGYGTFLFPAATLVKSKIVGIDIDKEMIALCKKKAKEFNISNVDLIHGDISTYETLKNLKIYSGMIDYVSLFNILHCEEPLKLLKNVYDILNAEGKIGVIHWKYGITPRGPSMEIRPTPETIIDWAKETGFNLEKHIDLPPYHYGLVFVKKHL